MIMTKKILDTAKELIDKGRDAIEHGSAKAHQLALTTPDNFTTPAGMGAAGAVAAAVALNHMLGGIPEKMAKQGIEHIKQHAVKIARAMGVPIEEQSDYIGSQEHYNDLVNRHKKDLENFRNAPETESLKRAHLSMIAKQSLENVVNHPLHPKTKGNLQESSHKFAVGSKVKLKGKESVQGLEPKKVYTVGAHTTKDTPAGQAITHVLMDDEGNAHHINNAHMILQHNAFGDRHPVLRTAGKVARVVAAAALEESIVTIPPQPIEFPHPFHRDNSERLHNSKVNDLVNHAKKADNYADVKHYHTNGEYHSIILHKDGTSSNPIITKRPSKLNPRFTMPVYTNEEATAPDATKTLPLGVEKQGPGEKYGPVAKSAPPMKDTSKTGIIAGKTGEEKYKEFQSVKPPKSTDLEEQFSFDEFNSDNPVDVRAAKLRLMAASHGAPNKVVDYANSAMKAHKSGNKEEAELHIGKAVQMIKDHFKKQLTKESVMEEDKYKTLAEAAFGHLNNPNPFRNSGNVQEDATRKHNPTQLFSHDPESLKKKTMSRKDVFTFLKSIAGETAKQASSLIHPAYRTALKQQGSLEEVTIQLGLPYKFEVKRKRAIAVAKEVKPGETVAQAADREKAEKKAKAQADAAAKQAAAAAKMPKPAAAAAPGAEPEDHISQMSHEELANHVGMDHENPDHVNFVKENRKHVEAFARENPAMNEAVTDYISTNPRSLAKPTFTARDAAKFVPHALGQGLKTVAGAIGKTVMSTVGGKAGAAAAKKAGLEEAESFRDISTNRNVALEYSIQEIMKESYKKKKMMEDAMNVYIATPEQREDWLNVGRGAMDVSDYINKYKV
jgi:hypothetical protein